MHGGGCDREPGSGQRSIVGERRQYRCPLTCFAEGKRIGVARVGMPVGVPGAMEMAEESMVEACSGDLGLCERRVRRFAALLEHESAGLAAMEQSHVEASAVDSEVVEEVVGIAGARWAPPQMVKPSDNS